MSKLIKPHVTATWHGCSTNKWIHPKSTVVRPICGSNHQNLEAGPIGSKLVRPNCSNTKVVQLYS